MVSAPDPRTPAARHLRRSRFGAVSAALAASAVLASVATACSSSPSTTTSTSQPPASGPLTVYVRPGGPGPGEGTQTAPYTSLAAARNALRPRLAAMHADAVVLLAGGTYHLATPFTLTPADSGRNGFSVDYRAEPGTHPVISGGYTVTGWHLQSGSTGTWVAAVPSWLDTRQLYVDGQRAQVAQGTLPVSLTPTPTGYTASSTALDSWSDPSQMEFVYPSGPSNWTESRCRVASVSGVTVTMSQPCWDNTTLRPTPGTVLNQSGFGQPLKVAPVATNAHQLLTRPGQWYLNTARHLLYYRPRPGQSMATAHVVAPVLQTLVQGRGSPGAPIHDITFSGVTFSYATWLEPSSDNGYSSFQAGLFLSGPDAYRLQGACNSPRATCPYTNYSQIPGNVSFGDDRKLAFTGDTFTHLGAVGLALGDGSQDDTVSGDLFTDTSGSGLSIGGVDQPRAPAAAQTSGDRVTDNYFHATSAEYQDNAAVFVGYARNTLVSHNQIDHVPYSGISIGWGGWRERLPHLGPLPNYSQDNVISDNLIFDHMRTIVDGGGIYTNGIEGTSTSDAERIEGNVVMEQHNLSWGIYTDNGTMYVHIGSNVVWDALYVPLAPTAIPGTSPYFSFGGCGGGPITYAGNFSVQADPSAGLISANLACGGHPLQGVTVPSNHVIGSLDQVPAAVLDRAGLEPAYAASLSPAPRPSGLPPYTQYPA